MRKKDNNLNRGQVHRNLVYELLPRGVYSKRLREQSASVCVYYLLSHLPLAIAVLIRHPWHVRFYRSVTIVTGGFRTVILQRRTRHRDRNRTEREKSDDNTVAHIPVVAR